MNVKDPDKRINRYQIFQILEELKEDRKIYYIKNIKINFEDENNKRILIKIYNLLKNYDEKHIIQIVDLIKYLKKKELNEQLKTITNNQDVLNELRKILDLKITKKSTSIILSSDLKRIDELLYFNISEVLEIYKYKMSKLENNEIYILELKNQKYYVGMTSNLEQRLKTHKAGRGAGFTKENKPLKLLGSVNCKFLAETSGIINSQNIPSQYDCEELVTVSMISKFGIERVEGAQYLGKKSRNTYFSKFCNFSEKIDFILKLYNI